MIHASLSFKMKTEWPGLSLRSPGMLGTTGASFVPAHDGAYVSKHRVTNSGNSKLASFLKQEEFVSAYPK
jgi:hypothetical protein